MDYDDIQPVLNPCQAADLAHYLATVQPDDRVRITLAVCRLDGADWIDRAGLSASNNRAHRTTMAWRWMQGHLALPLGAAYRLAKVIGLHASDHMFLLFEHQIATRTKMHQPSVRWVNEEGAA
jgi:hypothetical protein